MFEKAFEFKHWALERTLGAIESIDIERYPVVHQFCCQQLNHMIIVEDLFKARLKREAEPHAATNTDSVPEYADLKLRLLESSFWYQAYVADRDVAQDHQRVSFLFTDGQKGSMTVAEILFHIVNHGSYHRGTIARALDLAEVPHPADIFTMFLHQTEPARRGV